MRIALPLIFIFLTSCSQKKETGCDYITDYYQTIYQAELAYELKEYGKAFELYQSAFNKCTPINTRTYNEIGKYTEICLILRKDKQALDFIESDLNNGYELKWKLENPAYGRIFKTEGGQKLITRYDNIRSEYLMRINLELRKEIQEMSRLDQLYRFGKYVQDKQDSIDNINTKRLIEIFEQFGYPNDRVIGSYSIDQIHTDISTMLLHTDDSIRMNYFVPKLKEFVKAGVCSPKILGEVIDQFHLYNGQPQIYGTYRGQNSRYATMIEDRTQVNKNRISIGLPSLELDEKIDSIKAINYPELYRLINR